MAKYVCEGQAFEQADDNEKAKEAYSRALRLEPGNSEAREGSERCKGRLDKETKRINEEKARKEVASNYSEVVKGVEIEMVYVKGGEYEMGCGDDEKGKDGGTHRVRVNDFYIGKYEVTVGQWRKFVEETNYGGDGENWWGCSKGMSSPDYGQEDNHPVSCVSWVEAVAFIEWFSRKTGKGYRLPTEAEWEYAARGRGGKVTYGTKTGELTHDLANYEGTGGKDVWEHTSPVGSFAANALGLCDMSGNVWEWCNDVYGSDYYKNSPADNPLGPAPASGSYRVIRGGSWFNGPRGVRAAFRGSDPPSNRDDYVGFRLARTL